MATMTVCPLCRNGMALNELQSHAERYHIGRQRSAEILNCGAGAHCQFQAQSFNEIGEHCFELNHPVENVYREKDKLLIDTLAQIQRKFHRQGGENSGSKTDDHHSAGSLNNNNNNTPKNTTIVVSLPYPDSINNNSNNGDGGGGKMNNNNDNNNRKRTLDGGGNTCGDSTAGSAYALASTPLPHLLLEPPAAGGGDGMAAMKSEKSSNYNYNTKSHDEPPIPLRGPALPPPTLSSTQQRMRLLDPSSRPPTGPHHQHQLYDSNPHGQEFRTHPSRANEFQFPPPMPPQQQQAFHPPQTPDDRRLPPSPFHHQNPHRYPPFPPLPPPPPMILAMDRHRPDFDSNSQHHQRRQQNDFYVGHGGPGRKDDNNEMENNCMMMNEIMYTTPIRNHHPRRNNQPPPSYPTPIVSANHGQHPHQQHQQPPPIVARPTRPSGKPTAVVQEDVIHISQSEVKQEQASPSAGKPTYQAIDSGVTKKISKTPSSSKKPKNNRQQTNDDGDGAGEFEGNKKRSDNNENVPPVPKTIRREEKDDRRRQKRCEDRRPNQHSSSSNPPKESEQRKNGTKRERHRKNKNRYPMIKSPTSSQADRDDDNDQTFQPSDHSSTSLLLNDEEDDDDDGSSEEDDQDVSSSQEEDGRAPRLRKDPPSVPSVINNSNTNVENDDIDDKDLSSESDLLEMPSQTISMRTVVQQATAASTPSSDGLAGKKRRLVVTDDSSESEEEKEDNCEENQSESDGDDFFTFNVDCHQSEKKKQIISTPKSSLEDKINRMLSETGNYSQSDMTLSPCKQNPMEYQIERDNDRLSSEPEKTAKASSPDQPSSSSSSAICCMKCRRFKLRPLPNPNLINQDAMDSIERHTIEECDTLGVDSHQITDERKVVEGTHIYACHICHRNFATLSAAVTHCTNHQDGEQQGETNKVVANNTMRIPAFVSHEAKSKVFQNILERFPSLKKDLAKAIVDRREVMKEIVRDNNDETREEKISPKLKEEQKAEDALAATETAGIKVPYLLNTHPPSKPTPTTTATSESSSSKSRSRCNQCGVCLSSVSLKSIRNHAEAHFRQRIFHCGPCSTDGNRNPSKPSCFQSVRQIQCHMDTNHSSHKLDRVRSIAFKSVKDLDEFVEHVLECFPDLRPRRSTIRGYYGRFSILPAAHQSIHLDQTDRRFIRELNLNSPSAKRAAVERDLKADKDDEGDKGDIGDEERVNNKRKRSDSKGSSEETSACKTRRKLDVGSYYSTTEDDGSAAVSRGRDAKKDHSKEEKVSHNIFLSPSAENNSIHSSTTGRQEQIVDSKLKTGMAESCRKCHVTIPFAPSDTAKRRERHRRYHVELNHMPTTTTHQFLYRCNPGNTTNNQNQKKSAAASKNKKGVACSERFKTSKQLMKHWKVDHAELEFSRNQVEFLVPNLLDVLNTAKIDCFGKVADSDELHIDGDGHPPSK